MYFFSFSSWREGRKALAGFVVLFWLNFFSFPLGDWPVVCAQQPIILNACLFRLAFLFGYEMLSHLSLRSGIIYETKTNRYRNGYRCTDQVNDQYRKYITGDDYVVQPKVHPLAAPEHDNQQYQWPIPNAILHCIQSRSLCRSIRYHKDKVHPWLLSCKSK